MGSEDVDTIDWGILYLLQRNARDMTTTEIAEQTGVSSTTVSTRIKQLEDRSVIQGYYPEIDYEHAGLSFHLLCICTIPVAQKQEVTSDILEIPGVISVRELLTGTENLHVEAIGETTADITVILECLEDCGVDIVQSELLDGCHRQPYAGFATGVTSNSESACNTE